MGLSTGVHQAVSCLLSLRFHKGMICFLCHLDVGGTPCLRASSPEAWTSGCRTLNFSFPLALGQSQQPPSHEPLLRTAQQRSLLF